MEATGAYGRRCGEGLTGQDQGMPRVRGHDRRSELDVGDLPAGDGDGGQRLDAEDLGEPDPPEPGAGRIPGGVDHGGEAAAADHDTDLHRLTSCDPDPSGAQRPAAR